jgi:checkpoint serine/threonine-protein kinase
LLHQGGRKYQIKGYSGTGAFAKLYKAIIDGNTEETVALKVKDVSIIKIKPGFCA